MLTNKIESESDYLSYLRSINVLSTAPAAFTNVLFGELRESISPVSAFEHERVAITRIRSDCTSDGVRPRLEARVHSIAAFQHCFWCCAITEQRK